MTWGSPPGETSGIVRIILAALLLAACSQEDPKLPSREDLVRACPQAFEAMTLDCPAIFLDYCPDDAGSRAECPRAEEAEVDCNSLIDRRLAECDNG